MALRTKKPSIEDYLAGAKADLPAPVEAKPAKGKGSGKRGKVAAQFKPKAGEPKSSYNLIIDKALHVAAKTCAASLDQPLCDFYAVAIQRHVEYTKAQLKKKQGD